MKASIKVRCTPMAASPNSFRVVVGHGTKGEYTAGFVYHVGRNKWTNSADPKREFRTKNTAALKLISPNLQPHARD